jgi:hypothetical protein
MSCELECCWCWAAVGLRNKGLARAAAAFVGTAPHLVAGLATNAAAAPKQVRPGSANFNGKRLQFTNQVIAFGLLMQLRRSWQINYMCAFNRYHLPISRLPGRSSCICWYASCGCCKRQASQQLQLLHLPISIAIRDAGSNNDVPAFRPHVRQRICRSFFYAPAALLALRFTPSHLQLNTS